MNELFNEFYQAYPRKQARKVAEKAFAKLNPDPALFALIMEKLELFKKSPEWKKNGGQFVPFPATWLNQHRWTDEITLDSPAQKSISDLREKVAKGVL